MFTVFFPPNLIELFNYLTRYAIFNPTAFFCLDSLCQPLCFWLSLLPDSMRQPPEFHLKKSLCCSLLNWETSCILVTLPQHWQSLARESNPASRHSHPSLTTRNLSGSTQDELLFVSDLRQEPGVSCMQLSSLEICVMCSRYSAIGHTGQRNDKWPARKGDCAKWGSFTRQLNAGGDSQQADRHFHI